MVFYDRKGAPAVYLLNDGEHLYFFDGRPAAYLLEDAVYAFDGEQLGWLERGWIRDLDGRCVLFGDQPLFEGPAWPSRKEPPARQEPKARPFRRQRRQKTAKAAYKPVWSDVSPERFFGRA